MLWASHRKKFRTRASEKLEAHKNSELAAIGEFQSFTARVFHRLGSYWRHSGHEWPRRLGHRVAITALVRVVSVSPIMPGVLNPLLSTTAFFVCCCMRRRFSICADVTRRRFGIPRRERTMWHVERPENFGYDATGSRWRRNHNPRWQRVY